MVKLFHLLADLVLYLTANKTISRCKLARKSYLDRRMICKEENRRL